MSRVRFVRWLSPKRRVVVVCLLVLMLAGITLSQSSPQNSPSPSFELDAFAFVEGDKLNVLVGVSRTGKELLEGKLVVDQLTPEGGVLHSADQKIRQTSKANFYRFTLPTSPNHVHLRSLRVRFLGKRKQFSLRKMLFTKPHETALTLGKVLYAGTKTQIRCLVYAVKGVDETVMFPGSKVSVDIMNPNNGKWTRVFQGDLKVDGPTNVEFKVPKVKPGKYKLFVNTDSVWGSENFVKEVEILSDSRILLVSDKPVYQPGQTMNLRAMVLSPMTLRPVADKDILFEIQDSKGNKVFKKKLRTSHYGVAGIDFDLASEVNLGNYQLQATVGEEAAKKTVTVKRYRLPKFKVKVLPDKKFYSPKENISVKLQSNYFFGKPVSGSKVRVNATLVQSGAKPFFEWVGKTDDKGVTKLVVPLKSYLAKHPLQSEDSQVRFEILVTDKADHTQKQITTCMVSKKPIRAALVPEGGKLIPGLKNRVYITSIYPNGSPAECEVKVWPGRKPKGKPIAVVETNELGLGEFTFQPEEQWLFTSPKGTYNTIGQDFSVDMDLVVEARDKEGNVAQRIGKLHSHPVGDNLLLRPNKAMYEVGERLELDILTTSSWPTIYLDVFRGGQAVFRNWVEVKEGKAHESLDLPAEIFGSLEIHAYQILPNGEVVRDSRIVYVKPKNELKIKVSPSKQVYRPGEPGRIRFYVTDTSGKPRAAALGVIVVDEAVYSLQDMQPGMEKAYFTLQQRLQEAKVKGSFIVSSNKLDKLIRLEKLTKEQNQIAKLLFTAAQAQPPQQWLVFPNKTRRHKLQAKVNALTWALFHTALANPNSVLRFNPKTKTWSFPTGLLQRFKLTKTFQHYFGNSPFQLKWNEISRIDPDFSAKNLAKAVLLERVNAIGIAVQFHSLNQLKPKIITLDSKIGRWKFTDNALKRLVRTRYLSKQALVGPDGKQLTLDDIARMEKGFTAENLARHVTRTRMENLAAFVTSFVPFKQLHFEQGNSPQKLPTKIPKHAFAVLGPHAKHEEDVWGRPIILWWEGAKRTKYDLVSAGSDGKFGTGDDLRVKPDSANAPPVLPWWREVAAVPKGHFVPNSSIYRNANVSLFKMANLPGFRSGSVLFNFSNNYYNYGNFNPISGHYQFGHQFGFTSHPIQLGNLHFGQIGFNIGFGNINPNFGRQGGCFGYCPRNGFGISMVGFNIGSGFNIGNGFGLGGMPRGNFNGYSRTFNTRGYAFGGFNIGGGFGIGGSPGLGRLSGQGAGHINGFEQGAPTPRIQFAPVFTAPKMAWAVSGPGKLKGNKAVPVPVRVRNFFPETMLWQPQIITDDKGEADMVINFADSITTWRLSASANSISGALGGTSKALKVFQDFFVDIDLPIALTQGDEIAIPVAVYNYLKKPQTVKIELLEQPWFSLLGNQQKVKIIKLQPNEVTSVKFHIRAHRAGSQSLTVKAAGSKKSDAVKRHVQVVPDGRLVESVINGYLDDRSEYTLAIPHNAVPGSYKHVVRIFPGVLSELIEGLEGMLRMPSGCFEQTSSSAYPNILIAEYLRKNRIASPKIMAKAEKYLNFGYQRLLTFEHHPNGGFSLYGRGEPSAWLTAYGLHEFHDMGKVWPVDPQVIQRSQKFLLDRRLRDGSWNVRYRPNRLAATCYITWALAESGVPKEKLKSSLDLIRNELKTNRTNTYTLALGANALAAVNDESTGKILHLLRRRANTANDKKAICFHAGESTLSRSQGLYATVETTALAILAFSRANLFAHDLPKLTNYLVQAKTSGGTWGTTSATVFALKALVAVRADSSPTKPVPYQIIVDGVPVAQGGITQENLDVMQLIDLHKNTQPGKQKFTIKVDGNTSATFQLTTRYYVPWAFPKIPANQKGLELQVSCNRLLLAPEQKVDIKAKIRNTGKGPAYNVMLDLGVPPGFEVEEREFEALVEKGKAKRFEVSGNRVILYLSTMRSGEFQTFEFSLRAKQSGRVQIPPSVAYEYYNPTNRATSGPVTFTVRKKD